MKLGLDAFIENINLVFKDGKIRSLWLHSLDNTVIYPPRFPVSIPSNYSRNIFSKIDKLQRFVFTNLFECHSSILIDCVYKLTKVSKKL
ncbi:ferric iron reductase [Gloeocapsopsis dulcis]|uniref:ferric iron reductase n=1 Tax=Gloeocapsopsis dulcis TaxID=2859516 RepID=UPI0012DA8F2D